MEWDEMAIRPYRQNAMTIYGIGSTTSCTLRSSTVHFTGHVVCLRWPDSAFTLVASGLGSPSGVNKAAQVQRLKRSRPARRGVVAPTEILEQAKCGHSVLYLHERSIISFYYCKVEKGLFQGRAVTTVQYLTVSGARRRATAHRIAWRY